MSNLNCWNSYAIAETHLFWGRYFGSKSSLQCKTLPGCKSLNWWDTFLLYLCWRLADFSALLGKTIFLFCCSIILLPFGKEGLFCYNRAEMVIPDCKIFSARERRVCCRFWDFTYITLSCYVSQNIAFACSNNLQSFNNVQICHFLLFHTHCLIICFNSLNEFLITGIWSFLLFGLYTAFHFLWHREERKANQMA